MHKDAHLNTQEEKYKLNLRLNWDSTSYLLD